VRLNLVVLGDEKLALTPLKVTTVAPVKCRPLMNTSVFVGPKVGLKSAMKGPAPTTVKGTELVYVPFGVVTLMGPRVALAGCRR